VRYVAVAARGMETMSNLSHRLATSRKSRFMQDMPLNTSISVWVFLGILVFGHCGAQAQSPYKAGAAEKSGRGWPYPEPADRGASGFSPDYSRFTGRNERWDIYVNILWRKIASKSKQEIEYYDEELSNFQQTLPDEDKAKLQSAKQLAPAIEKIRVKALTLPYRELTTGCILFLVKHGNRVDLAADDCVQN
jgi:hypothetical protein